MVISIVLYQMSLWILLIKGCNLNNDHHSKCLSALTWARVSEHILNGTSAQLGCTLPFTSVDAGKYRTEDKSNTDISKTKHNPEKANNTKHSKTKLAWFSRFLRHFSQEMRWACSTMLPSQHGATWAFHCWLCWWCTNKTIYGSICWHWANSVIISPKINHITEKNTPRSAVWWPLGSV